MKQYGQFIPVNSDDGYFSEDYDTTHCIHGKFVGYPGGADYICQLCEDGCTKQVTGTRYKLYFQLEGDERKYFHTAYNLDQVEKLVNVSDSTFKISYELESYTYWIRPNEESD